MWHLFTTAEHWQCMSVFDKVDVFLVHRCLQAENKISYWDEIGNCQLCKVRLTPCWACLERFSHALCTPKRIVFCSIKSRLNLRNYLKLFIFIIKSKNIIQICEFSLMKKIIANWFILLKEAQSCWICTKAIVTLSVSKEPHLKPASR